MGHRHVAVWPSVAVCAALWAPAVWAQSPTERRNWFDDPFFQVTTRVPGCPVPAGPFLTEAEERVQSHGRAERGTTCWLAGKCEQPNSYAYDKDIAQAVQQAFHTRERATIGADIAAAWDASSAAAGSLMLLGQARQQIETLSRPPELR